MQAVIANLAYRALICEVEATPKPGLVDRANNGAHKDMDLALFYKSAESLRPYFTEITACGLATAAEPIQTRLPAVRPMGMAAERAMFAATSGVNTHKGAIFTLGILCFAAGRAAALGEALVPDTICRLAADMCHGVERELTAGTAGTKGERAYAAYGITGIRGEAARGFPSVRAYALPSLMRRDIPENERMLEGLMRLIANVDDTNILTRAGRAGADYAKEAAGRFLAVHRPTDADYIAALCALDADFIARNLSPGGCADLVAAAWFLDALMHAFPLSFQADAAAPP